MVDEGLLGLTRFEAPDLHKAFYRKEALGIKTWDLFDSVIGAYSGNLERILAIGGGDEAQIDDAANKPKRFPPVVRFLGAFHLDAGQTKEHSVELPSYLGAVRIMAVASDGTASVSYTHLDVYKRQLETSQFDVGGETVQKGLKGVLYGERGVWRPGDDIHLTFVLQDLSLIHI